MSLLIKALASAEKGKQTELAKSGAEAKPFVELDLEPLPAANSGTPIEKSSLHPAVEAQVNKAAAFNTAAAASVAKAKQQSERNQDHERQAAANVFVANQAAKQPASISALLSLGVAGALIIWLGLQGYQYFTIKQAPVAMVVAPEPPVTATNAATVGAEQPTQIIAPEAGAAETPYTETPDTEAPAVMVDDQVSAPKPDLAPPAAINARSVFAANKAVASKPEQSYAAESGPGVNAPADELKSGDLQQGSPLKLLSRTPAAGVDPTLQAAYEAYSRGDDAAAQTQYRQVLQADVRNVDALLGMAAIAARQSRHADANGWYQKVLEIEPRNSTALSAVANLQIGSQSAGAAAADYAGTESQIKTMLSQQPEAANLHAALGNLYAAQNQWSQAQAAYFNASRYAPNSAEYAFNLAVSLDQLGKSGLALAQYQRALSLLNNADQGNLDKAQLEARIKALQQ